MSELVLEQTLGGQTKPKECQFSRPMPSSAAFQRLAPFVSQPILFLVIGTKRLSLH